MNIGVDGRKLEKNKTGIGNYLDNIFRNLINIDNHNQYFLFVNNREGVIYDAENVHIIEVANPRFIKNEKLASLVWLNISLIKEIKRKKIDIFWGPNFLKPIFFPKKKSIITIHDLAFIENKDQHSKIHSLYLKILLKLNINKQIKILTVSEYSKSDILKIYDVPKENVYITYCAIDNESNGNKSAVKLPDEYMLFVGTLEKRKNLNVIFESLHYTKTNGGKILPLVVVGAKGNGLFEVKQRIKDLSIENDIVFTGYVTDEELNYIYSNAKLFIFPSFYEGFGIPLLEAMKFKVPIISSNRTSLPEVAANAAEYFSPDSPSELSEKINLLMENTARKNELVNSGIERINDFSWKKSAEVLCEAIKEVEGGNN